MMALLMNILLLLKPSHLEIKRSGALEYCKIKGRTGKLYIGLWDPGYDIFHSTRNMHGMFCPCNQTAFSS